MVCICQLVPSNLNFTSKYVCSIQYMCVIYYVYLLLFFFIRALLEGLELDNTDFPNQLDSSKWVDTEM